MTGDKGFGPAVDGEAKECKFCRKQIDQRATRCPYCQSWQSRRASMHGWQGTRVLLGVIPMLLLAPLLIWTFTRMPSLDKEDFEEYRTQVKLVETKMTFDDGSVVILGKIQNDSPVTWEDIQVEVTYYDVSGNLIDIHSDELRYVTTPAGETVVFKISGIPKEKYASFKVRIVTAEEPMF